MHNGEHWRPQGCVLSVSVFSIYESDSGSDNKNCVIIKYADDTMILGLLGGNDHHIDNCYTAEVERFIHWCEVYFLDLNVKKAKQMIFGFRGKKTLFGTN